MYVSDYLSIYLNVFLFSENFRFNQLSVYLVRLLTTFARDCVLKEINYHQISVPNEE